MDYKYLLELANKAMDMSYSPYSNFRVGAALMTSNGNIYLGANIENSSFGATICAERIAIFKAVSEGHKKISAIAITSSNNEKVTYPCGICRQVMLEFFTLSTLIICSKNLEQFEIYTLDQLLPHGFEYKGCK